MVANADNRIANNFSSTYGRLPLAVPELQGKWLNVIALDENNVIDKDSNGCGDTMAWCLGASRAHGYSTAFYNHYSYTYSATVETAHVVAAVAIVASSFPAVVATDTMTLEEARAKRVEDLVEIILTTADDLGIEGVDEVYGYGALNLARATEPITEAGEASITAFGNQRLAGRKH